MADKSILDQAEEQFSSIKRKTIEVPEWETTIYAKPLTLNEKRKLYRNLGSKSDDISLMMVESVILKAEDKDGKKMFSAQDILGFKTKADTNIIAEVSTKIMGTDNKDLEDNKKN